MCTCDSGTIKFCLCLCLFQYLDETADNLDGLPFKLHDFGFRGSTSVEVKYSTTMPCVSFTLTCMVCLCALVFLITKAILQPQAQSQCMMYMYVSRVVYSTLVCVMFGYCELCCALRHFTSY